jgi:hypothetical protein
VSKIRFIVNIIINENMKKKLVSIWDLDNRKWGKEKNFLTRDTVKRKGEEIISGVPASNSRRSGF